jgi:hypothetical protein
MRAERAKAKRVTERERAEAESCGAVGSSEAGCEEGVALGLDDGEDEGEDNGEDESGDEADGVSEIVGVSGTTSIGAAAVSMQVALNIPPPGPRLVKQVSKG